MIKHAAGIGVVVVTLTLWIAAVWANWRGLLPLWVMFVAAPCLLVAVGLAAWLIARDRREADALSPWRRFRAARAIALTGGSQQDCTLVLDLVPEWDLVGPGVTLRFHGVARLVVRQFGPQVLHFDYLKCEDRGAGRRNRKRFKVQDGSGEAIQFTCDSFEQVRGDAGPSPGAQDHGRAPSRRPG